MLRLFQAGVTAACLQGLAILLTTLSIFFYAHHRIENLQVPADDPTIRSLIPLLQLTYLVTAMGVATTRSRFVDLTAERIRRASRLMNRSDPERAASTLMISLWFTAVGFAALTLGPPPSILTEQGRISRRRPHHLVGNDEHRGGKLRCERPRRRAQAIAARFAMERHAGSSPRQL